MNPKKLEKGDRFYHPALNTLLACRDAKFNLVYNEEDLIKFENGGIRHYLPNNSGRFYSTDYVYCNDWKVFEVIKSELGGWGSGQGVNDVYPDAWQVYCRPVDNETVIIHFNQLTTCMAYTIPEVMSVDDDVPIITPEGCICVGTKNGESTCYTLTEWENMKKDSFKLTDTSIKFDVIHWLLIQDNKYPKDKWLIIETSDKAHHIAYYSSTYNIWISNSKFGGDPIWWAEVPSAPHISFLKC